MYLNLRRDLGVQLKPHSSTSGTLIRRILPASEQLSFSHPSRISNPRLLAFPSPCQHSSLGALGWQEDLRPAVSSCCTVPDDGGFRGSYQSIRGEGITVAGRHRQTVWDKFKSAQKPIQILHLCSCHFEEWGPPHPRGGGVPLNLAPKLRTTQG